MGGEVKSSCLVEFWGSWLSFFFETDDPFRANHPEGKVV